MGEAREIAKYPTGPLIGIPGAPAAMTVNRGAISAWAVCDTAGRPRSGEKPVVTSIAGTLDGGGRAAPLADDAGVLVTFEGKTYVIWGGKRSQVDPASRAITLSLGLDPGVTSPVEISRALYDGLPATEPLRVPDVPQAGAPSKWVSGSQVGAVLQAQTAGGGKPVLRSAARRGAEDHQLRRRPAPQRQLLRVDGPPRGDPRRAGQHSRR